MYFCFMLYIELALETGIGWNHFMNSQVNYNSLDTQACTNLTFASRIYIKRGDAECDENSLQKHQRTCGVSHRYIYIK